MKQPQRFGISLRAVAAVIAAVTVLLVASQAHAQMGTVRVGSATVNPGASDTIVVRSTGIAAPGLGAWEIGIIYDPTIVSAIACSPDNGSVCNTNFSSNRVQVVGASSAGLTGDANLASITFQCITEGTSVLSVALDVFADATPGDLQPISPAIQNGLINCEQGTGLPPNPTSRPSTGSQPTSTPVVITTLPDSGTGGTSSTNWTFAAVTLAGLTTVAGISALALQRRRSS